MRKANKYVALLPSVAAPRVDGLGRPTLAWAGTSGPDTAPTVVAACADALESRDAAQLAFAITWGLGHGVRRDAVVRWLLDELAARGGLMGPGLAAVADAGRAAADAEPERAAALLATTALRLLGLLGPRRPLEATPAAAPTVAALFDAIAQRAPAAAAAQALGCHAAGTAVLPVLQRAAARHPGDAGCAAILVAKLADALTQVGTDDAGSLLASAAAALAARPEATSLVAGHTRRLAALADRLAAVPAEDPDKAKLFAEPKFRVHLLGSAEGALKAVLRAAEVGLPHAPIAGSLTLAAAERLLQVDPKLDSAEDSHEDRSDVEQLFVLCSAVRQLQRSLPPADWLPLLLFAVTQLAECKALTLPDAAQMPLPEPLAIHQTWDHGPEIAKVLRYLLERDGEQAIAALRAYFLHVLPEQPLMQQLREVAVRDRFGDSYLQLTTATVLHAALDELAALGAHPHRELTVAAALRSLAAQRTGRGANRLVEAALSWQASGWTPQNRLGAGPL